MSPCRLIIRSFFGQKQEEEEKSWQGSHFHLTQKVAGRCWEYNSPKKQETHSSGNNPSNSAPLQRTSVPGHTRSFAALKKSKARRKCYRGLLLWGQKAEGQMGSSVWRDQGHRRVSIIGGLGLRAHYCVGQKPGEKQRVGLSLMYGDRRPLKIFSLLLIRQPHSRPPSLHLYLTTIKTLTSTTKSILLKIFSLHAMMQKSN